MSASDNQIFVNSSSTAVTLTLPAPSAGRVLSIKDSTGNAATHNITINPHSSETIDGASSLVLSSAYADANLVSDGTNWFVNATVITTGAQTIAGAKTFTSALTANSFIPTSSSIPTNGLYLSAANSPTISANSNFIVDWTNGAGDSVQNLNASANQTARNYATINSGSTSGAAYFSTQQSAATKWSMGMDLVNTSNSWVLANSDGFGTSSKFYLQATTGGSVTIGASSGTQIHNIYGKQLNLTAPASNNFSLQLTAGSTGLSEMTLTGQQSSSSADQGHIFGYYYDGTTDRNIGKIQFFNTSSATASSAGGAIYLGTSTTAGTVTTGFILDNNQNMTLGSANSTTHTINGNLQSQNAIATAGYDTSSPTTGSTVSASANTPGLLLTPAGTLATLTVKLPSSPIDGQQYWVATSQTITAITWQDSGGTAGNVVGGPSSLTTAGVRFVYNLSGTKWYSIG